MSDGVTVDDVEQDREYGSLGGIDRSALAIRLSLFALWALTILGGMALVDEVKAYGLVMFQDPGHVANVGVFGAIVLAATAVMVLAFRHEYGETALRAFLALNFGLAVGGLLPLAAGVGSLATSGPLMAGLPTSPLPIALGLFVAGAVWSYPEWFVTSAVAVLLGIAIIPRVGLGFGPLPIVVLLVVWAAYDAYSVYVSGHMKELASGVSDLKLPLMYVVPHSLSVRLVDGGPSLRPTAGDENDDESDDPQVTMLGLGDAAIPGMLAVSAGEFLDAPAVVPALNANLPAIGAVVGGLVGMVALLYIVNRVEGMHAGLPPLNAGVLTGYLVGAVAAGIPLATALGL